MGRKSKWTTEWRSKGKRWRIDDMETERNTMNYCVFIFDREDDAEAYCVFKRKKFPRNEFRPVQVNLSVKPATRRRRGK